MVRTLRIPVPLAVVVLSLLLVQSPAAALSIKGGSVRGAGVRAAVEPAKPLSFHKALVIDDRISVLRRAPSLQSEALRRLRLGHVVFIIHGDSERVDSAFCRIAVSRRTRGWILRSALAAPGRVGEDRRVMKLIEATRDGLDRIALCRILIERFGRSPLVARALLLMGEEAERAAVSLSQRARRRLGESAGPGTEIPLRDYYLSDPGLDRYSRMHIVFDFNVATSGYVYDGGAYREVIRRFPNGDEARVARQHLNANREKTAGRH